MRYSIHIVDILNAHNMIYIHLLDIYQYMDRLCSSPGPRSYPYDLIYEPILRTSSGMAICGIYPGTVIYRVILELY